MCLSVSVSTSIGGVDVAHGRMDVDRLDRVAGDEMDRVEHLGELQQIGETGLITGAAHAVETDDVRRTGNRSVGHPCAADVVGSSPGSSCAW